MRLNYNQYGNLFQFYFGLVRHDGSRSLTNELQLLKCECWKFSGRKKIYAIVTSGGKQYRVSKDQTIEVEKISGDEGAEIELTDVHLIDDGEKILVGQPSLEGAMIKATIVGQAKRPKTIVFKYKSKKRYRRKTGHRQPFTRLNINQIVV